MIRIVDKNEKAVVQKVINRKGETVRYQVVFAAGDCDQIRECKTLTEARLIMKGTEVSACAPLNS